MLAAEAEQWQIMSLEETQAASSPMRMDRAAFMSSPQRPNVPEDCMTSPQALMMSASPNDAWQPGRLREVMQVSCHTQSQYQCRITGRLLLRVIMHRSALICHQIHSGKLMPSRHWIAYSATSLHALTGLSTAKAQFA